MSLRNKYNVNSTYIIPLKFFRMRKSSVSPRGAVIIELPFNIIYLFQCNHIRPLVLQASSFRSQISEVMTSIVSIGTNQWL
jgi:hypothetical protein